MTEDNSVLNEKIQTLEKSRQEQEKTLKESKITLNSQKEEIDGLLKQVVELERYYLLQTRPAIIVNNGCYLRTEKSIADYDQLTYCIVFQL